MKRFFVLLVLFCFYSCIEQNVVVSEETISDTERWLNEICSSKYKGRKAGTKECDAVAEYLSQELARMGFDVLFQDFNYKDSLGLRNVYVIHQGASDSLIVIGAHYDGAVYGEDYQAADDNGSGVVAVLSICKTLSESRTLFDKSILLAFWAAEEVTLENPFNGSRFFVGHFDEIDKIVYYCNIDCFAHKDQGIYFYYSPKNNKVGDLMSSFLDGQSERVKIVVKENEKFNSDYVPFIQAKIPYFGWNDFDTSGHIHSTRDNIKSVSIEKINRVVHLSTRLVQAL